MPRALLAGAQQRRHFVAGEIVAEVLWAGYGFALSGARLDTLDKQRVATLVYRYRLHTIDVFVRPELAHAPSALRTVRGFNVAHATGSWMDWLAVSDVSADVLAGFVQRLAREAASR